MVNRDELRLFGQIIKAQAKFGSLMTILVVLLEDRMTDADKLEIKERSRELLTSVKEANEYWGKLVDSTEEGEEE